MNKTSIKEYTFKKATQKRIPVSGTFELTSRCNLSCRMCFIHMDSKEQCKFGEELSTKKWLSIAKEAIDNGMMYCLLTGGEPLLRKDFKIIYKYLVENGVLVSVNTNGILINSEIIQLFQEYRPEKINISLYGASDETYVRVCGFPLYKQAMKGILSLKEAGINVNINTTFTKLNIVDLDMIVSFAKEHRIPIRMTSFVFPPVRNGQIMNEDIYLTQEEMGKYAAYFDSITMNKEQFERKIKSIKKCLDEVIEEEMIEKKLSCMAGRGSFWISWNGEMYPCGMLDSYKISMEDMCFKEAWKNICEQTDAIYLPKECSVCKFKKVCAICAAITMNLQGNTNVLAKDMCERTYSYIHNLIDIQEKISFKADES